MLDIQNSKDCRNVNIDKVGVKDIRYPITVMSKTHGIQQTVGSFNMYVNLPREFKLNHMSRFIEIINECHGERDVRKFKNLLE
ncbi:MAG: GTP cyclohydrolase I FolE2, partial [Deltaproteobacteria bacterium]